MPSLSFPLSPFLFLSLKIAHRAAMLLLRSAWRYDAALVLVVLIWGLNFPIIKVPLEAMHPFTVNLFRFVVSVGVLGGMWAGRARRQGKAFIAPFRQAALPIIGFGLLGHASYQVLFILGIARTSAGSAALIIASAPIWTSVFSHVFGIERLQAARWAGLLLSALGVGLVVVAGSGPVDFSASTFVGNVLMLVAALFWGLYAALSRPVLNRGIDPLGLTFFSVLVALPVLALLGVSTLAQTQWMQVSWLTWAALLFSGGLSTGLAYYWWNVAVRQVGPAQTAAFSNLVPFVALAASSALLSEPITPTQLVGGALIVGGVALVRHLR